VQPAGTKPQPKLKLCLAMLTQHIDQNIGQSDVAATGLGFWRLETNAVRLG
jgi:hypothetical protein